MDNINFIVYYGHVNLFRTYNYHTKKYEDIERLPTDISNFYLPIQYDCNDSELKLYAEKLKLDRDELLQHSKFDYIMPFKCKDGKLLYRNHNKCVVYFFNMYSTDFKTKKSLYEHHEKITALEYKWIQLSNNGGLVYNTETTEPTQLYNYDYTKFYENILISEDFTLPYREGYEKSIKKIPEKLIYGFYKVKIMCSNPEFNKIFNYSKYNVYTHFSLKFAQKYQQEYDIKIDLVIEPNNCLLYEQKKHIDLKTF